MPIYWVTLRQSVIEQCIMPVDASDAEQAEQMALEQAITSVNSNWRFVEIEQDPEVIDCRPAIAGGTDVTSI